MYFDPATVAVICGIAAGIAAIQEMRGIGLLSFNESIGLVVGMLKRFALLTVEGDRECRRLALEMVSLSEKKAGEGVAESAAGELALMERRYARRSCEVFGACLRRFGEHEAATLLLEQPNEFARWVGTVGVGARDGPED